MESLTVGDWDIIILFFFLSGCRLQECVKLVKFIKVLTYDLYTFMVVCYTSKKFLGKF